MHDSAVGRIAHDGSKREAAEFRMLGAKGVQLFLCIEFGEFSAHNILVKPAQELHHRNTVVAHRTAESLLFCRVLHHADCLNGTFYNVIVYTKSLSVVHNVVVDGLREHVILPVVVVVSNEILQTVVVSHLHTRLLEVFVHLRGQFALIHEEDGTLSVDQEVRKEDGVVDHIATAQVKRPSDFRKVVHDEVSTLAHVSCLTDALKFACHALTCQVLILNAHGGIIKGGTVAPKVVEGVFNCLKREFFSNCPLLKLRDANHFSHKDYDVFFLQLIF